MKPASSPVLMISGSDVRRLLPMRTCIDLMVKALGATAEGKTFQPLRQVIDLPGINGVLSHMPGYLAEPEALGSKLVTVFPGNSATPYSSHQGIVILFDVRHGRPMAIINASQITAIRTAAASGLATRLLAREESEHLLIVGCGEQASTHLEAMLTVRRPSRVTVWGRDRGKAKTFADAESARHDIAITVATSLPEAVGSADIVCTTTASDVPIVFGRDIRPGTHLNVVGSSVPSTREIDGQAFAMARVFVDLRAATVTQGGDYLAACREGLVDESHILGEIGDLVLGRRQGRLHPGDVTLFKSLGIIAEDLAAAHHIHGTALQEGVGTLVDFN